MKLHVPPHIAWPAFVVLILLIGIGGSMAALFAARSDGGAQIVDNYYQVALRSDTLAAMRREYQAAAWKTDVSIEAGEGGLSTVNITVSDSAGQPVHGLRGIVRISKPSQAQPLASLPFSDGADGLYRVQAPLGKPGLLDFEIEAVGDTLHTLTTVRKSWQ